MSKARIFLTLAAISVFAILSFRITILQSEVEYLELKVGTLEDAVIKSNQALAECRKSKEASDLVCKQTEKSLRDLKTELESRKHLLEEDLRKAEGVIYEQKPKVQDSDSPLPSDLVRLLYDSCRRSNQGSPCPHP